MSDCPATSLVKLSSEKVVELAGATVARIDAARATCRAEFESQVDALIARRAESAWRWLLGSLTREAAVESLSVWGLTSVHFHEVNTQKRRKVAVNLLRAANLATEVWVSISDLAAVSK